jgi:hypothetical protein
MPAMKPGCGLFWPAAVACRTDETRLDAGIVLFDSLLDLVGDRGAEYAKSNRKEETP